MAGSFTLDLRRFQEKVGGNAGLMRMAVRKIALELFTGCVMKSPVKTGRFRANWGVMVGQPYLGTTTTVDPSGNATVGKVAQGVAGWNAEGSVWLCNNLSYSIGLEYGRSNQAPAGMVRVSIAEVSARYGGW